MICSKFLVFLNQETINTLSQEALMLHQKDRNNDTYKEKDKTKKTPEDKMLPDQQEASK